MPANNSLIKSVSIILPTYNESENIIPLIKEIIKEVKYEKQIIVVDDDSPDGTSDLVRDYMRNSKRKDIELITRLRDRGLTKSLTDGIKHSREDIVVWLDCDFSMPPSVIPRLLKKIEEGNDIAIASRYRKDGKAKTLNKDSRDSGAEIIFSFILNKFLRLRLGGNVTDYTSGFIAARRYVFDKISLKGDYGEYFIDLMVRAVELKFSIAEVGYVNVPRLRGTSKTAGTTWQLIKRGLKYIKVALSV